MCRGARQHEHIDSSSLKHLQSLAVVKRMRAMGSAVECRVVRRKLQVVPKCSIGTEAPSLYAKTSNWKQNAALVNFDRIVRKLTK